MPKWLTVLLRVASYAISIILGAAGADQITNLLKM